MGRRAEIVYRRTQVGTVTVVAVGGSAVLLALIGARTGWHPVTVAVMVALGMVTTLAAPPPADLQGGGPA